VEVSQAVYNTLVNDFMKPRIDEVSYPRIPYNLKG
jgi:hypothetical protein